ncbi:MAG: hypothetical protein LCH51_02710 [Bacteroidetes bacterium]|nr:hypothetical protein [Bacteroidota bacterium]
MTSPVDIFREVANKQKKRHLICVIIFSVLLVNARAQNIEARYSIRRIESVALDEKTNKEIQLDFEGFLYKAGSKVISFWKPLYLAQYPTGTIEFATSKGSYIYGFCMDTMQFVNVYHTDSLRVWSFFCTTIIEPAFTTTKYKAAQSIWKILPETRLINGLLCKHALQMLGEKIYCEIWYYPDVKLGFGMDGLIDVPGTIVQFSSDITKTTYQLIELKVDEPIDPAFFWPDIFKKAKFYEVTQNSQTILTEKMKSDIMNQP